jgi:dTDP-4-amino-4,6-dideoxygalactose transaminase
VKVPFVDLRAEYTEIGGEVRQALGAVIESAQFVLGPAVQSFEGAFAAACGADHCVGVSSGTDAIKLSLEALGVGPGDEVIVPANSFAASALAVSALGARPRLVDCEEESHLLDPAAADRALSDRTRAILPVHLYGRMVDLEPFERLGPPILEDAAQAHGAERAGFRAGSRGVAGCFSFYPSKNLGAYGDAGAVVTSDEGLAEELRRLRHYGQSTKYHHERRGYNARLDSLQAAVLEVKLRHLADWNRRRRAAAAYYDEHLREGIGRPVLDGVFHLYVIRVRNRDLLQKRLAEAGIETGVHYPIPLHLQGCFRDLGHAEGDFPVAERLSREILSLPMYPQIRPEQLDHVVERVNGLAELP